MTLLQTATCTTRPLKRFEELLSGARMRIKPSKSCSFSIMRGARRKERRELVIAELERRELVIAEVTRTEEEQSKTSPWPGKDWSAGPLVGPMCERFPEPGLSFLIRSTYNTLPNPSNLFLWYGSEKSCQLCNVPNLSLQHILSSCKTALAPCRYRWRYDQILRKVAKILKACRLEIARDRPSPTPRRLIHFVRGGGGAQNITQPERSALSGGCEWNLRVDLDHQLRFLTKITTTNLRPDNILWSAMARPVIMAGPMVGRNGDRSRYLSFFHSEANSWVQRKRVVNCQLPWGSQLQGNSWEHSPKCFRC